MLWLGAFVHFNKSELWTLQCSFVEAWLFFLTASHKKRNIFPTPFAVFCIDLRVLWHVIRFFWDRCKFHPNCFYVFGHSSKRPRTQRQRQKNNDRCAETIWYERNSMWGCKRSRMQFCWSNQANSSRRNWKGNENARNKSSIYNCGDNEESSRIELRTEDYLILSYIEIYIRNHHSKIYHQRKKLKNMNLISTAESSHDRNSI